MVWQAFVHVVRWRCSTWQKRNQENGIAQKNTWQPCRIDLCVSFPSPKHDSDRSSGKRSRVLLHSAASSFRVACQTPKKGRSLRCVVEWSIIVSFVLAYSWLACLPFWVGGLMLTSRASGRKWSRKVISLLLILHQYYAIIVLLLLIIICHSDYEKKESKSWFSAWSFSA